MRRRLSTLVLAATLLTATAAADARAGVLLPTGRLATPAGRLTALQAFPTGMAVSPDGRTVLAIAGPAIQGGLPAGPSAGVAIEAVDAQTGAVRQTIQEDDAFQSIVFQRDGRRAYVAGGSGRDVHVLDISPDGSYSKGPDLPAGGLVSALALSHDAHTLWLGEPEAGRLERLDLSGATPPRVIPAPAPNQLLLSRDERTLYAANWRGRAISAISTTTGASVRIATGLHPTGLALTPGGRLLVANANDATLSTIEQGSRRAASTSLALVGRRTDSPNAVAVGRDGRAYVALADDNAIAVLAPVPARPRTRHHVQFRSAARRGRKPSSRRHRVRAPARPPWRLVGLIPTGWYPVAVALDPAGRNLHVITARGLAHSSRTTSPYIEPDPAAASPDAAYATAGTLESLALPNAVQLATQTRRVRDSLRPPPRRPPGENPVLAGARGPIRHVIYVTRENKTYDSELGDLHPGPGNAFVLFGQTVTPNLHKLERQWVESQSFTYQGFASVVGHMWEDAGAVSNVFERSIGSSTGAHSDHVSTSWHDPENFPRSGLLTVQAWRAGLKVRTYNQETAQESHLLPERFQAPESLYPNFNLHLADTKREAGWKQEFDQFEKGQCAGDLGRTYGAHCSLPSLEYVYLGEDHTTIVDEPGYPTIQAQVADNDLATGRLIEAVSHSRDWRSTVVVVVEDDPQGTGDSQSAYRGYVALASPWARRGHISRVPYNLTSAVGAIDRMLGLAPLTDYALTNRPLDDLFTNHPDYRPYTADTSGATLYPFVSLPGKAPKADVAHGVSSFAEPDETNPRIANAATWRQLRHTAPPAR